VTESLAAVQTAVRRVELIRFPVPEHLEPGFGLLRVEASGMCGTDVSQYDGTHRRLKMYEYPAVLGHEAVGHIVALTPEAQVRWDVKPGDRVAIEPAAPCTRCYRCEQKKPNLCIQRFVYAHRTINEQGALWGAYSEYMLIHPDSRLHLVRPELPIEEISLFNALGGGLDWTVRQSGLEAGDDVVLLGPGIRAFAGIIGARRAGAKNIIVVGRGNPRKAELARFYGATHILDSRSGDIVETVKEITGGGAQRIVDFTPHSLSAFTGANDQGHEWARGRWLSRGRGPDQRAQRGSFAAPHPPVHRHRSGDGDPDPRRRGGERARARDHGNGVSATLSRQKPATPRIPGWTADRRNASASNWRCTGFAPRH